MVPPSSSPPPIRAALKIDVDKEMALAVKDVGGEVLDEVLKGQRSFANADYLFRADNVIAELKRCEETIIYDEDFIQKVSALHAEFSEKWRREGRPDVPMVLGSRVRINVHEYPEEFQFAFSRLLQDRLATSLKKANAQIKETRDHFAVQDARGLLLFCVDGNTGLTLEGFLHVIDRLLRRNRYSGINGLIVFSANYTIGLPGLPQVRPFLIAGKDDRPEIETAFKVRLCKAWEDRLRTIGGPPVLLMAHGAAIGLLRQGFRPTT